MEGKVLSGPFIMLSMVHETGMGRHEKHHLQIEDANSRFAGAQAGSGCVAGGGKQ